MTHVSEMTVEKLLDFVGNKTAKDADPHGKARAEIVNRFSALEARVKELEIAGELALRYLENPEVRAIPFALHVDAAAQRLRAALLNKKG